MEDNRTFWGRLTGQKVEAEERSYELGSFSIAHGGYYTNFTAGDSRVMHSPMGRACTNVIAGSFAMSPLRFYKKDKNGATLEAQHNLTDLFNHSPNGATTSFEFLSDMVYDALAHGCAMAEVIRNEVGTVTSLEYLPNQSIQTQANGDIKVAFLNKFGNRSMRTIKREDLFTFKGIRGIGVQKAHHELFQQEDYLLKYTKDFFEKGGTYSAVLTTDQRLKDEQKQDLKKALHAHNGVAGNHSTLVMDGLNARIERLSANPSEALVAETNRFISEKIAQVFGVPAALVGLPSNTTFNNMEQQNILFTQQTLLPLMTAFQQAIKLQLFTDNDRRRWDCRFDTDAILRGDSNTQANVYTKYFVSGLMTQNEVRKELGLPAMEGGDLLLTPLNLGTPGGAPALTDKDKIDTPTLGDSTTTKDTK